MERALSVQYCQNSTITEAWALVLGLPARLDDTDAAVLLRAARARFPGMQQKPAIVAVKVQEPTPPFWREQVVWDDDKYLARFGHRYLSVHFIRKGDRRYETFSKSLQPGIEEWLKIYEDVLTRGEDKHLVDRIGFGYVNTFELDPEGFDLSRFFKMSFSVSVGARDAGLLSLDTGCVFFDKGRNVHLSVNLTVESPTEENSRIRVVTKVSAERRGIEDASFAKHELLQSMIADARQAAKDTFFSFATDDTHAIMGVVTDAAS
ncbi:MAG: TIGR04255 family protein [Pseudomonadota bacterium]